MQHSPVGLVRAGYLVLPGTTVPRGEYCTRSTIQVIRLVLPAWGTIP
jgi:hypothetical protein